MFQGTLRPFQEEVVTRMVEDKKVLVALDLGLGKTPCSIAAVERLIEAGEIGAGLVIVPASLKYQWAAQIAKFTNGASVLVVDGDRKQRIRQYGRIKEGQVEYAVLNYEQVVNDWEVVRHLPRDFIICDEVQAIKAPAAQRTRRLRKLQAHYKWGLTGQPVENRAEEVFHIMKWIDPDVLGPESVFDTTFIVRDGWGKVRRYRNLPLLHKALSRAMVRRSLKDPEIAVQMPKVVEESIIIPFDRAGGHLYNLISAELEAALSSVPTNVGWNLADHYEGRNSASAEMGEIMSRLTCLRMLCDHPELLRISSRLRQGIPTQEDNMYGSTATGSAYAAELDVRGLLDPLKTSPKLAATIDLVKEILEADEANKIVLFSFFKGSLALLEKALGPLTGCVLFHGDITPREREANKQRFLVDPKCRVFLSSDAGGVGVDLPVGNYLISLDLPWSAGAWRQRNGRIIRLSSEWEHVTVISMLMAGSIEERQYEALQQKQRIADAITDGVGSDKKGDLQLDLATLTEYLRTSSIKIA